MGYRLRRLLLTSVFAGTLTVAGLAAAQAATTPDVGFSPEQISAVKSIGSYFNGIHDIKGDFTQVGPQGNVSTGIFYISKPGRMRFEYAPPNPFIVVSDGTWVTITEPRTLPISTRCRLPPCGSCSRTGSTSCARRISSPSIFRMA